MQFGELGLDGRERVLRILARAQDDHAARDFAFAIEFGNAAPHLGADLDRGHIAHAHRHTCARDDGHGPEIIQAFEVAARAHHDFGLAEFEHRTASLLIGRLQGRAHLVVGHAIGREFHRIEHDLVLLDHAADGSHFGDIWQALELEAQEPVLQRAQLGEVVAAAAIDERVLVDPADAGRIGTERGLRTCGQPALHLVQVFEHPRACPIQIGAVFEQHIDEGIAEKREPAHCLRAWHRQHGGRKRIRDLVLDDLRRLARVTRADDDLHIRQIGQGVDRRMPHRPDAPGGRGHAQHQHQKAVGDRPADQARDHGRPPGCVECLAAASAGWAPGAWLADSGPAGAMLSSVNPSSS